MYLELWIKFESRNHQIFVGHMCNGINAVDNRFRLYNAPIHKTKQNMRNN